MQFTKNILYMKNQKFCNYKCKTTTKLKKCCTMYDRINKKLNQYVLKNYYFNQFSLKKLITQIYNSSHDEYCVNHFNNRT